MQLVLKNAQTITIRPIRREDAPKRHEFFVELSLAQQGIVHTLEEIDYHVAESEAHIDYFLKYMRGLWLLAFDAHGTVIGEIDLLIKDLSRVRHGAKLTMGILPTFQRQGLGGALLEYAIEWAKKHKLLRLELTVFAHNKAAIALYTKYGFVIEGVRKNFLRLDDGSFEDDLLMALLLKGE